MTGQEYPTHGIKVTRKRKRLYEPFSSGQQQSDEETSHVTVDRISDQSKTASARDIVEDHLIWAAGTALLPIPLVDMAALIAVQLRMLKKLCEHYGMEFTKYRGKALIASLLSGFQTVLFTGSLLKVIPGVGMAGAMITTGVVAGALTYAVGKVFILHFETGGTLLDFNPSAMKAHFAEQYKEGRHIASRVRQSKKT
jgi:uncharacterized protein (DUF697 family)